MQVISRNQASSEKFAQRPYEVEQRRLHRLRFLGESFIELFCLLFCIYYPVADLAVTSSSNRNSCQNAPQPGRSACQRLTSFERQQQHTKKKIYGPKGAPSTDAEFGCLAAIHVAIQIPLRCSEDHFEHLAPFRGLDG